MSIRLSKLLIAILAVALSGCLGPKPAPPVPGPAAPPAVSPERVAALWQECRICHSSKEMQRGPILDGMPAWYTELQLAKFSAGLRGRNPANRSELLMGGAISKVANAAEAAALAAHIASLPPIPALKVVKGDSARGQTLYAERCAACHGANATGTPALRASPLHLLEDWYVIDQLRKFRNGQRGHHPDDTDGKIMAAAMTGLTDTDLRELTAWIARQAP